MDTIFAVASAPGKCGVTIVRVSGFCVAAALGAFGVQLTTPRMATLVTLKDADGLHLDKSVVIYFAAPASFTGEDVVELHLHGSLAVLDAVLHMLEQVPGCRIAEPGEFTRRALMNGQMSLPQVEGLSDLIEAETEAQRKQAQRLLDGDLGEMASKWREELIKAVSLIEVTIDFADEEVPEDVSVEVIAILEKLRRDFESETNGAVIGDRLRRGFEVAILGPPNVGKSTLLNAIAGREVALVSNIAGTTRDAIETRISLQGLPVTFIDTAGLRETDEAIESMGMERALKRAAAADLRILLGDVDDVDLRPDDLRVMPKADMHGEPAGSVSGLTGFGVDELLSQISDTLRSRVSSMGVSSNERHRVALTDAGKKLSNAVSYVEQGTARYELAALEIREAIQDVDLLVGRVGVEDYLDRIFSSFCLGK